MIYKEKSSIKSIDSRGQGGRVAMVKRYTIWTTVSMSVDPIYQVMYFWTINRGKLFGAAEFNLATATNFVTFKRFINGNASMPTNAANFFTYPKTNYFTNRFAKKLNECIIKAEPPYLEVQTCHQCYGF